ncbi:MAG TPA: hypothetical protein VG034_15130 [Acidimicrobiia bacterium]|jgi:hypothetical protein|nr:hypothetical protein [Acidimicrobiia bacterium]
MARSTARAVRGAKREGDALAALAGHGEGAVAAFETERFDVGAERLGDPQPVETRVKPR